MQGLHIHTETLYPFQFVRIMATAKSNSLSEYELARLERIKENQQMLEELFPEGTSVLKSYPGRRRKRSDDDNSRGSGDNTPEQFDSPQKKLRYSVRCVEHVIHCLLENWSSLIAFIPTVDGTISNSMLSSTYLQIVPTQLHSVPYALQSALYYYCIIYMYCLVRHNANHLQLITIRRVQN